MTSFVELFGLVMVLQTFFAATWSYYKGREWQFWAFLCLFNLGWMGAL